MRLREVQHLIVSQAIEKARAGATNPARRRELAVYFIKAAGAQAKTKRLYTVAQACTLLLHSLDTGISLYALRDRLAPTTQSAHSENEGSRDVLVQSDKRPNSRPPASNTGDGIPQNDRGALDPVSRETFRWLEDYI